MNHKMQKIDVLVIGAGISGLIAARKLKESGLHVIVVDKSSQIGGRLATENIDSGLADLGAQFFTTRNSEFQNMVNEWTTAGIVYTWATSWSTSSIEPHPSTERAPGHPRYAAHKGMNALAAYLAQGLEIFTHCQIVSLTAGQSGWHAHDTNENIFNAQAVLITAPVPQSLLILKNGFTHLSPGEVADVELIQYAPCLAAVFRTDKPLHLPEPGAIQRPEERVPWIADNRRKGISPETNLVTVHASTELSKELWKADDAQILTVLEESLLPFLDADTLVQPARLKRWQYAWPEVLYPKRYFLSSYLPPLIFAGDAFGGPRIEGAVLSGLAASQVLSSLKNGKLSS
jgi:renalase